MAVELGAADAADLQALRALVAQAAPWAPPGDVEACVSGLVGAPVARRSGRITAVIAASTAGFGSVLAAQEHAADVADLYASLGEGWVDDGVLTHTVTVPAGDAETPWFDLSFGRQQVYAHAEAAAMTEPVVPDGVTVAEVAPEVLDEVVQFRDIITRHQACRRCSAGPPRRGTRSCARPGWTSGDPRRHAASSRDVTAYRPVSCSARTRRPRRTPRSG